MECAYTYNFLGDYEQITISGEKGLQTEYYNFILEKARE